MNASIIAVGSEMLGPTRVDTNSLKITAALESFDTVAAGRRIAAFADDLSNWYVRRSRRRFWEGPDTPEGAAAFATLYECLETVTRLMAPITPFITDYVWGVLRADDSPESVHLCEWPRADSSLIDSKLIADMALARRLVELGRSARASASVKTRQPLARALAGAAGFESLPPALRDLVAQELNVRTLDPLAAVDVDLIDYAVKPNFRSLGARFGKRTPVVAEAVRAADPARLAEELRSAGTASVTADGESVDLGPGDVTVTQTPKAGWAVAADGGETVALEITLTPELRREGLAREAIRLVQEARKNDGLDVTDRICLWWEAGDPELAVALSEQGGMIAQEVLAASYRQGRPEPAGDGEVREHDGAGLAFRFWLRRV